LKVQLEPGLEEALRVLLGVELALDLDLGAEAEERIPVVVLIHFD
jgi:hypothetical protein